MDLGKVLEGVYSKCFNEKFALISAGINGPIASAINHSSGGPEMFFAGVAQAASSFVSTGVTSRMVQYFSPINNKFCSYFFGSLAAASTTFAMGYVAHAINDTPELIESCIVPTVISYTTSYATNYITRKGYLRPRDWKD